MIFSFTSKRAAKLAKSCTKRKQKIIYRYIITEIKRASERGWFSVYVDIDNDEDVCSPVIWKFESLGYDVRLSCKGQTIDTYKISWEDKDEKVE